MRLLIVNQFKTNPMQDVGYAGMHLGPASNEPRQTTRQRNQMMMMRRIQVPPRKYSVDDGGESIVEFYEVQCALLDST